MSAIAPETKAEHALEGTEAVAETLLAVPFSPEFPRCPPSGCGGTWWRSGT